MKLFASFVNIIIIPRSVISTAGMSIIAIIKVINKIICIFHRIILWLSAFCWRGWPAVTAACWLPASIWRSTTAGIAFMWTSHITSCACAALTSSRSRWSIWPSCIAAGPWIGISVGACFCCMWTAITACCPGLGVRGNRRWFMNCRGTVWSWFWVVFRHLFALWFSRSIWFFFFYFSKLLFSFLIKSLTVFQLFLNWF